MSYVWMLITIKNGICILLARPRNKEYIATKKLNDFHVTVYYIFRQNSRFLESYT